MLVDDLYHYVLDMLSARHESCERIHLFQKPSKQFIIGSLADISKNYALGESMGESKVQARSALRHNSMSVFFLINSSQEGSISINPTCSIFYKVFPTFEEQKEFIEKLNSEDMYESIRKDPGFKKYFKRLDCVFEPLETPLRSAIMPLEFKEFISEVKKDENLYRTNSDIKKDLKIKEIKNDFDLDWIKDNATYSNKLDEIKEAKTKKPFNWEAKVEIEREKFRKGLDIITVRFINITTGKGKAKYEKFLFNCNLEINLNDISLIPFNYQFKYENFSYKEEGYLRSLNCQSNYNEKESKIKTKPFALFRQKKVIPRTSLRGVSAKFKDLGNDIKALEPLIKIMENQFDKYVDHSVFKDSSHKHNVQFIQESKNFKKIMDRFKEGVGILESDANARKAFYLMNQVFEKSSNYEGWRLFQIIFIIMIIPDITNLKKNRDIVDIIHVNTGGGKSEAYFGLVIFILFWDRLRGKTLGISAISKFPLRMLSIQQLQRIAKVIMIAEEIRKENDIDGEVFSVGYYVGVSEDFPRHTFDKIKQIKRSETKGESLTGVLLDSCPQCSGDIILDVDEDKHQILHKCVDCERLYHLYFTNSEVYRFLPSLIVSTVDKLAGVALNRRFKNLLGGKLSICSNDHGFTPRNDRCEVKLGMYNSCEGETEIYDANIEGPTLMIQDEMHLLREGFGTINSHFESLLNVLLKKMSKKEFKYIAMTATIAGAKNQIDHLYGKDYLIFPGNIPRGFNEEDDLFFEHLKDKSNNNIIQRILIGLKPNLRENQYASLLTIFYISNFIQSVKENISEHSKKYKISDDELRDELNKYQCILTYHGKKADVFGMNYFLHTVVTSKLEKFNIIGKPLTGDNTLAEIKDTILLIQEFPSLKENDNNLHVTFATSVVSHGVDIENWNIMIFQGITRDTSEYIQALSRVGRRYTGVIFLWFYPNRVRDLSYYKNFDLYHKILPLKVEKTPLSRWTKLGFKQTFTSIFCAAILNYMSDIQEKPIYKVEEVNALFDDIVLRKQIIEFIQETYYTHMKRVGVSWVHNKISEEVEDRLNYLKTYSSSQHKNFFPNALRDSMEKYYKTQYGMRGIQEQITLKLNENFTHFIHKYQKRGL